MEEEEIPEEKDASRPFLIRKSGEIGIYIDPTEATAVNPKEFGLEHFFMMTVREKLQDYLYDVDLIKIKGCLEKKRIFKGAILEEIRKGMVLILTFDDLSALENLWKLFEKDKLSPLFQELFVDKKTLTECSLTKLTIRAKMWEDEYEACKEEILSRSLERLSLGTFANDIKLLQQIREYQRTFVEDTSDLRGLENDFEQNVEEFMISVRRILPEDATIIKNLGEFRNSVKMAKGVKKIEFTFIDQYLETLEAIKKVSEKIETNICHRLTQVHGVCQTISQRDMRENIRKMHQEVTELLSNEHSLLMVRYKDWEGKVSSRDRKLFLGLISLVPLTLEKLTDIDHEVDEFITAFPEQIPSAGREQSPETSK